MKKKTSIAAICILTAMISCDREIIDHPNESRVYIKPSVQSVIETKAASGAAYADSLIATYTLSEDPDYPLYLQVYERDLNGLIPDPVTKGQVMTTTYLNNTVKSFNMQAYADAIWHDNTIPASSAGSESNPNAKGLYFGGSYGISVVKSSTGWNLESDQTWLNDVPLSFWSWDEVQPVIEWNSTSERYDKASISDFTVNSTVTSQIDPILAYNGEKRIYDDKGEITDKTSTNSSYSRTDNELDIQFQHALAAVIFDVSGVDDDYSVDNITLSKIYPSGDCSITVDTDGILQFDWTAKGTPQSFSQDFVATDFNASGLQPLESSSKVFFMIPQVISTSAFITVSFNGFESFDKSLQTGSVEWKAGKYYTYKLTKSPLSDFTGFTFTFEDGSLTKSEKYSSQDSDLTGKYINVVSKKSLSGGTDAKEEWRIKSYQIDGESSVTVEGKSFEADGLKVKLDKDNSRLDVTVTKRVKKTRGDHAYWINSAGRTDDLGWSPADWSTTTASNPVDLSMYNFQSDAVTTNRNTANCYIVRHAGTYRIPLIYGNAITANGENTQAYQPTIATGGSNGLTPFKNYKDLNIKSPYIENSFTSGSSLASNRSNAVNIASADIVWQDHSGVISLGTSPIVGSPITSGAYGASNVRYLQFTVNNSAICQCNAVIAVKDAGGNIVWSWHIWVTNDPALSGSAITVKSNTSVDYGFLPVGCLGWIEPAKYDERPDIKIVLEQLSEEDDITVTIKQPEKREYGYGTYYQFGRKDAMPKNTSLTGYDGTGVRPASLGEAISHPGTFYQQAEETRQWCTNLYFNLWTGCYSKAGEYVDQTTGMIKTIYDPCPPGYKVPAPKAFSGFTTTNGATASDKSQWNVKDSDLGQYSGLYFYTSLGTGGTVNTGGPTVFLPVCGYIDRGTGSFGSNSSAFYWSSVSSSQSTNKQGQSYKFSSSGITTNNSNSAIEAFSIRPVQE